MPRCRVTLPVALIMFALASCTETPVTETKLEPQFAGGPPAGFPVVMVRAKAPSNGNGPIVSNIAEAVARVRADGTIRIDEGTYDVSDVIVDKPVTIVPQGDVRPVLRVPAGVVGLAIDMQGAGEVIIREIDFQVGDNGLAVDAFQYDRVTVDDASFEMGVDAQGVFAGAQPGFTPPASAAVLVQNSRFNGGALGVFYAGANATTLNSTFANHSFSGIQYQQGARGRIEGNTVDNCGTFGCIRVHMPDNVDITRNRVSNVAGRPVRFGIISFPSGTSRIHDNDVAAPLDAFSEAGIFVGNQAVVTSNRVSGGRQGILFNFGSSGVIENNTVEPCGSFACIIASSVPGAVIEVRGNKLRSTVAERTFFAILATAQPGVAPGVIITNNEITGVGAPANPNNPQTWPMQIAMQAGSWPPSRRFDPPETLIRGAPVIFSNNRMTNVEVGVRAFHGGVVEGRDNTFTNVFGEVFGAHDRGINRLQRNDVNGYRQALAVSDAGVGPVGMGTLEVQCNWWGTPAGPTNTGTAPPSSYTPWATQPIANQPSVTCN